MSQDRRKKWRLPDFLCIGTQKGGTTSLQKLLEQHPGAHVPNRKELQYFSINYDRGEIWYASHFETATSGQRCGEITPYYLFHPEAPERIHRLIPEVRLIVLLRDPVERALSQYFHARRHGFETLDLEKALEAEGPRMAGGDEYSHQRHSYISRSRYEEQLSRYESLFSAEQMLVMKSEDLFERSTECWSRIQEFIEVPVQEMMISLPKANSGKGERSEVALDTRKWMRDELKSTATEMYSRYGIGWDWN